MKLPIRGRCSFIAACVAVLVQLSSGENLSAALDGNATLVAVTLHNESAPPAPKPPPPPPQPPTAKSAPPAPKSSAAAKPPPPAVAKGAKATPKSAAASKKPAATKAKAKPKANAKPKKPPPTPVPAALKKQFDSMDAMDAKSAAQVAHAIAKAVVAAAWSEKKKLLKSKKGKGSKKKGKGKTKKLTACQKEKLSTDAKKEEEIALKRVLGNIGKCEKGHVPEAAFADAKAVLQGKMPPGAKSANFPIYEQLVRERQMAFAAKNLKKWSIAEKKAKKRLKKENGKKRSKSLSKAAMMIGELAAAKAAVKATLLGFPKGKSIHVTQIAVAKAIATHLLKQSGKSACRKARGKGCKKGAKKKNA